MMLRRLLLAGTFLAALPVTDAYAACTPTVMGNLNVYQCTSTQSANDGDDLMYFLTKTNHPVTSIDGSLGANSSAGVNQNVTTFTMDAGASFTQQGSGFAELDSNLAGSPLNTLRNISETPIVPSTLKKSGDAFLGFDGFLMRGQVDDTNTTGTMMWDGMITMTIDFGAVGGVTPAPVTLTFMGDTRNDDIGTIGFDEKAGAIGLFVTKVTFSLDSTGAWNQVKQFDFSVPGQVAGIPEPSTWLMGLIGFAGLGMGAAFRRRLALY